ncbi:MAG: ABC transporter substrate-binding protein, partial [Candidatus Thorarchaeota archaeon]
MGYGRIVMIGFLTLLLAPFITAPLAASNGYPYPNPRETGWGPYVGPYVDKIVLHEIHSKDQQVLALQDGDIDLITDSIDPSRLESIREVDTIEIVNKSTNSLVAISFNCMKYPYNITALRRAIAIAIDKNETIRRIQGSGIPLDTCVPSINPYSAEGFLDSSYYSSDLAGARALLTSAGFVDWDEQDGFLEAPDHTELVVKLEYPFESESAEVVCNAVIETLLSLNIRAEAVGRSSADYYMKYWMHEDYDAAFIKVECDGLNIDWLGNEYWSGNSKRDYFNIPNFSNDSYDSYRNHLLFSMYPDEIYEAAFEMQRIWTFQCPMVVLYEEIQYIAYRTDKFENFSTDTIFGPLSWWTMSGIHLRDELGGPYGGTFRMGVSDLIDTFNPLFSDHWASWQPHSLMYDSLLRRGPEGEHYPWLAGHLLIETNSDNPKVPTNHTRLTFSLKPSMEWTDNHPITAEDVAYTINLLRELQNETLPNNLEDLFAAYNIGDSVVVA